MSSRVQIQKPAPQEQKQEVHAEAVVDEKQALKDEMDALLDEIDAVLEENAEEFVKGYIQKGGQ
jgi:ubiquitin-like protein Pup